MTRRLKIFVYLCLLCGLSPPLAALELFGISLETTRRDELRDAAKRAGVVLIREGSADIWFDVYDSSAVLPGSRRLYLGFVKQDQRFAFAEYEFNGIHLSRLLNSLNRKYGNATVGKGRFVSDRRYRWQRDGIEIQLNSDWNSYKTRLIYLNPVNMVDLVAERDQSSKGKEGKPLASIY